MSSSEQTGLTIVGAAAGFVLTGGNPMGVMYSAKHTYGIVALGGKTGEVTKATQGLMQATSHGSQK